MIRKFLHRSTALLLAAAAMAGGDAFAAERKPNIIVILTDDMGMGDVGCFGGSQPTPNIDRIAQEGTRFEQYYSASPICSPSRAGLLTGIYPSRWNITSFLQTRAGNRGCEQADYLDPKAPTLPAILKTVGYATAHFGKWHLGGGRDVTNAPKFAVYGYDENASTYESPEPHPDITATNWIWSPQDKVKRWERTAFFVDKTLDFLKRNKDKPCFVNLWPDDVHDPWVPDENAPKGSIPRNFRPVLKEYDRQIGRLLDGIKEAGLEKDTIVVFTSDNGALPTFQGERSGGLRGSKLSLYEGGIRMPFIAKWPGKIPQGAVDKTSVLGAIDLLPTFAAIAGAKLPDGVKFDGSDKSSALLGAPAAREGALFWEYGRNDKAFKFPKNEHDRSPWLAVREGKWKLLVNPDGTGAELYDLEADRSESTNVADQNADVTKRLTAAVLGWRKGMPKLAAE